MSLKYVPPNALFLITSIGLMFGLNSIYNTPLSLKLEFFTIFIASFFINITNIHSIVNKFNS